MSGFEAVGILGQGAEKLLDYIQEKKKKEELKEELYFNLETEIINYKKTIEEMANLIHYEYFTRLDKLDPNYTPKELNDLVQLEIIFLQLYSNMVQCHIDIARGCVDVSHQTGFMKELLEYQRRLHDFVLIVSKTYKQNNSVRLGSDYFRFLKKSSQDFFSSISDDEISQEIKKGKKYAEKIKKYLLPIRDKEIIIRKNRNDYSKSRNRFIKMVKKLKIDKSIKNDLTRYLPKKLVPLVSFSEDIYKIKEEEQKKLPQKNF